MFYRKTTVPRITRTHIVALEASIPGLSAVSTIPVIETREQALTVAETQVAKTLERYEHISRTTGVEETDTGWVIEFRILGD